jgi:hypothetical protein
LALAESTMESGAAGGMPDIEIREQLSRILAAAEFKDAVQLRSFLSFVVETVLAGRADRIKSYSIAVDALGRDTSFNPQTDPIVRVEAGRLRRALAQYYALGGRVDPVVIEMPRGSYIPSFRRRSLPIGLRKPSFSGRRALYRVARLRLIALIAAVAFGVSLLPDIAMLAWRRSNDSAVATAPSGAGQSVQITGATVPRLYVEPVSVSGAPLSNSISSSIFHKRVIDALVRFDDLTIATERPPGGAGWVSPDYSLASGIHYYGDGTASVAISASDSADGAIIWSKTFEGREHNPVVEQQGAMVREMIKTLLQPFGVIASRETAKRAAGKSVDDPYRCVLDSHDYLRGYDLRLLPPIRTCLEAAVAKSSSWVTPFVQLARIDVRDYQFGITGEPGEAPALDRAFSAANRAIEIKPTSAAAYNVLQDVMLARGDILGARKAGEIAVGLNPYDRFVVVDHALLLILLGETEAGLALMQPMTSGDPILPSRLRFGVALAAYLRGDPREALAQAGATTGPLFPPTLMLQALVAAKLGDHAGARRILDRLYAAYPAWRTDLRDSMHRFLPDAGMVDRIASDFTAATADLTQ